VTGWVPNRFGNLIYTDPPQIQGSHSRPQVKLTRQSLCDEPTIHKLQVLRFRFHRATVSRMHEPLSGADRVLHLARAASAMDRREDASGRAGAQARSPVGNPALREAHVRAQSPATTRVMTSVVRASLSSRRRAAFGCSRRSAEAVGGAWPARSPHRLRVELRPRCPCTARPRPPACSRASPRALRALQTSP
jgi:hypothetical protein